MINFKFKILFISIVLLLQACATTYQRMGFLGGVNSKPMTKDIFIVEAKGNSFTSESTIEDYLLLKAAETTIENKAKYFTILEKQDRSKVSPYTNPYNGVTSFNYKPASSIYIKVFTIMPTDTEVVFEANDVILTIKNRVGGK